MAVIAHCEWCILDIKIIIWFYSLNFSHTSQFLTKGTKIYTAVHYFTSGNKMTHGTQFKLWYSL